MTAKRFTVDSDGKYWDRESNKYVTIDHLFYLVEKLEKENEELKSKVKRYMEIELLKTEDANCYNCKHNRSVYDDVSLDGMCAIKGLMNIDGYFDTEYHKLPKGTLCPHWELEE